MPLERVTDILVRVLAMFRERDAWARWRWRDRVDREGRERVDVRAGARRRRRRLARRGSVRE